MLQWLPKNRDAAFTLVEVLVAIAVLALLVVLFAQLFSNATTASTLSTTHMEADARVRLLFGRMAADFTHMVKRTDVDYYLKPAFNASGPASMNDQIAFYSEVPGYSSASDAQNSVSLVGYRLNPYPAGTPAPLPCIERLGTALSWGGGSAGILPVVFGAPTPLGTLLSANWPTATMIPGSSSTSDPAYDQNYETIVPNAFRFECYYLLHSGALSANPWDTTTTPAHSTISGLRDVAGIGVVIAVTDRKASAVATFAQLQALALQLKKFPTAVPSGLTVGGLQQIWQPIVSASTLPPVVKNGIRIYEQVFCIDTPSQ